MGQRRSSFLSIARSRANSFVLVVADAVALLCAIAASLLLRFDTISPLQVFRIFMREHLHSLPFVILIYILAFSLLRLYRYAWRFASLDTLWSVIGANSIGLAGLIIVQALADKITFPRSVLIILWTTSILITGGVRVMLRVLSIARSRAKRSTRTVRPNSRPKQVVILGGEINGARILRAVREDPSVDASVIGFLDDDPTKRGTYISNVKVLGSLPALKQLMADRRVDEVIVALSDTGGRGVREYVMECRKRNVSVKVIPRLHDVLSGKGALHLEDFSIDDLLRRTPSYADCARYGCYLAGKRVLVTGAGGSIGRELCRQIASQGPASLVLLGHGENSIHLVHQSLKRDYPNLVERLHCVIASVAHEARIEQVFQKHKPEVVFHAAAHKHVPMMEANEQEAVHNNVLGTYCVSEACGKAGVERMVLISTDKAADPCCVMGATKRLCEEIMRYNASVWRSTCYVTVRFGNVLGSRGSLIPTLCDQIKSGGPVTITHPDMSRYFMTIPEAVRLVLQAGGVGESGQLYLLDMGEPVKIVDLVEDVMRLFGYEPGVDIEIEFTGPRPGEKLHERLTSANERIEPTRWEGLTLVKRPAYFGAEDIPATIKRLAHVAEQGNALQLRRVLDELVPRSCAAQDSAQLSQRPTSDMSVYTQQ